MRHATPTDATRSRLPRTALLVGAAIAAPMAAVGVANARVDDRAPDASGAPNAVPGPSAPTEPSAGELEAVERFYAAGYEYCDAEALAGAQGTDAWEAKVGVGARLLAGEPVDPPSGCVPPEADPNLLAFWDHGYAYCDAVALADAMGTDPYEAKIAVGAALVAGEAVPAPPSGCAD